MYVISYMYLTLLRDTLILKSRETNHVKLGMEVPSSRGSINLLLPLVTHIAG